MIIASASLYIPSGNSACWRHIRDQGPHCSEGGACQRLVRSSLPDRRSRDRCDHGRCRGGRCCPEWHVGDDLRAAGEQSRLGKHPGRLDYLHDGKPTALDEDPRDLAVNRARDVGRLGHLEVAGAQGLNYLPSFVEDLYEAPVVRHRADDGVFLLVMPDRVGMPGHGGDDRYPGCLRGVRGWRAYMNPGADPLVTVRRSEKKLGLP